MRTELKPPPPHPWGPGRCLTLFSRELNHLRPAVATKARCPRGSRGGGDTQTLREGSSRRLATTAGKVESFIESVKHAAWSTARSRRGLGPGGDLPPSAGADRGTDCGGDCLPMGTTAGSIRGGGKGDQTQQMVTIALVWLRGELQGTVIQRHKQRQLWEAGDSSPSWTCYLLGHFLCALHFTVYDHFKESILSFGSNHPLIHGARRDEQPILQIRVTGSERSHHVAAAQVGKSGGQALWWG